MINGIPSFFTIGPAQGIRPQPAAGGKKSSPDPSPVETAQLSGSSGAVSGLKPGPLAEHARQTGADAMPLEGKVASLLSSTPGPEPLSPERVQHLRHEMQVLGELGYLQAGHPDFPKATPHDKAFGLMEQGHPVFWRETPNSDAIPLTSWTVLEETAREARDRTRR